MTGFVLETQGALSAVGTFMNYAGLGKNKFRLVSLYI